MASAARPPPLRPPEVLRLHTRIGSSSYPAPRKRSPKRRREGSSTSPESSSSSRRVRRRPDSAGPTRDRVPGAPSEPILFPVPEPGQVHVPLGRRRPSASSGSRARTDRSPEGSGGGLEEPWFTVFTVARSCPWGTSSGPHRTLSCSGSSHSPCLTGRFSSRWSSGHHRGNGWPAGISRESPGSAARSVKFSHMMKALTVTIRI